MTVKWKQIINEPIFHFFIGGILIFILYYSFNPIETRPNNNMIIIDEDDINRLAIQYEKSWNYKPDKKTTEKLIQEEIQNEILYREALRMNLDHNDEIIQRRLKQKFEFLIKDLIDHELPAEDELQQYYDTNSANYFTDKTISFQHFYFNPDERNDPKKDAQQFYFAVRNSNFNKQDIISDNSHIQGIQIGKNERQLRQEFGQNFSKAIMQINEIGWQKPIASGFGIHLVNIDRIEEATQIPFEEIKDKILLDFQDQKSRSYNKKIISELRKKYDIKVTGTWDI